MDVSKTYRHINEQLISSENTVDKNADNFFFPILHEKNMQMNKWRERHMPQKSYYIPFKKTFAKFICNYFHRVFGVPQKVPIHKHLQTLNSSST